MFARIGFHLAVVHADQAKLEHAHLACQHLDKQLFRLRAEAAPKVGQRVVVWMRAGGDVAERDRVAGRALNLEARRNASSGRRSTSPAVPQGDAQQNHGHHEPVSVPRSTVMNPCIRTCSIRCDANRYFTKPGN